MNDAPLPSDRMLEEACRNMFSALGCAIEAVPRPTPAPNTSDVVYGVLGFAGEHVRGSLVLELPLELLRLTHPRRTSAPATRQFVDWAGEVTNQVLGRLKNRCAAHGVDFGIGVPTVVAGQEIALYSAQPELRTVLWFRIGEYAIGASLEMAIDAALARMPAKRVDVLQEGELLIF